MSGMDRYGEGMLITRIPTPASSTSSSFARTSSPGPDLFTSRLGFNPQDGQVQVAPRHMKFGKNVDHSLENRSRSNSRSADKGKEPVRGHAGDDMSNFGREHYVPHYNRTAPYLSQDKTRPSTADGILNGRSKNRGSLLVAASDALGFRFGRRKPPVRQLPGPIILPDVIEISARRDEEDEERNHLKQMAAQAIGLSPFMVSPDRQSREDSTSEEDYDEGNRASGSQNEPSSISDSVPNVGGRSPHGSSLSVSVNSQQPLPGRRYRSGSVSHSHSNSLTLAPIPPFPTSVAALSSFKQRVGDFPKYYPPSSLRLFALSKNWKTRYLILSSPATLVTRSQSPAVSYLHLFKSSNREEKELERLEINEDSVIFVSEEEVGGKRHVIKVGGADVGAMKKEYTHEEGGHTMWLLQIPDPAEAQKWITDIKNAILGQRTVRAGLIPRTVGNNEPHGDMDVMLTIRAQGLVTSPNSSRNSQALSPINTSSDPKGTYASSISSHSVRSQTTVPKSPTSGAVQTLKGLFTNSVRPRSSSRAASIDSERQLNRESTANEDSFTSRGSNLLSMLRSSTPDVQSINTNSGTPPVRNLPLSGPVTTVERRIDRKILSERPPVQWVSTEPTSTTVNRERFARGFSLQPPPRRRWVSMGGGSEAGSQDFKPDITVNGDSSRRNSLSLSVASTERAETEPPSSPGHLSAFQITPEQRPRAPSLQSISTYASADNALSLERSSSSTKRSSGARSARRWSRQSALPNRLTPPTEPPPAIPTLRTSLDTHHAIPERAVTPTSVQSSDKSVVSSLPSFSKRASGSSVRSINSFSTSHSNAVSASSSSFNAGNVSIRTAGSHRISMPPPRPAPTFAPPPAPTEHNQDVLKPLENIPSTSKSSFRNSVVNRTFRLSTIAAPKPPPSTTLPPRPDEPEFKTHRRSNSGSSTTNMNIHSTKLETIHGSPIPPPKVMNPFPPPVGPLPPTPVFTPANGPPLQPIPLPKRATSIKQRLRGLSASSVSPKDQSIKSPSPRPFMSITTAPSPLPVSVSPPPATPIAEKITLFQNDPSFLQMHTPILQPLPPPPTLLASLAVEEEVPEVTSLSPPPRRGSKQLFETELEPFKVPAAVEAKVNNITTTDVPRHLSLSRPGSIISHHSHHSQENLDLDHVLVHEHEHEDDWESPRDETPSEQLSEFPEENMPSPRHMSLSRPGSVISLGAVHV